MRSVQSGSPTGRSSYTRVMGSAELGSAGTTQRVSRFERIVTGDQPWGWSRVTRSCYGVRIREAEIYPSGTGTGQRWLLAVDRVAPAIGGLAGLIAALILGAGRWIGLVFAVVAAAAFTALTHRLTRGIRRAIWRIGVVESVDAHGLGADAGSGTGVPRRVARGDLRNPASKDARRQGGRNAEPSRRPNIKRRTNRLSASGCQGLLPRPGLPRSVR